MSELLLFIVGSGGFSATAEQLNPSIPSGWRKAAHNYFLSFGN